MSNSSAQHKSIYATFYDVGVDLCEKEDYESALINYLAMLYRWDNASLHCMISALAGKLQDYELAEMHARIGVKKKPKFERASRLLFAALRKKGKEEEAFEELERFVDLTGIYSDEYDLMLRDLDGTISEEDYDKEALRIEEKKSKNKKGSK